MKLAKYFTILIVFSNFIYSQFLDANETQYFISPKMIKSGVVTTDNIKTKLYLISENETKTLLSSRGCGQFFTISPDQEYLGTKIIDDLGMETPILLNISTSEITPLSKSSINAGQVSFSTSGLVAFTQNTQLHISDGKIFDLGYYSNLAPISPDANFVAFNNDDDQIFLLNLKTGEKFQITNSDYSYYYPQWSPDSKKILLCRFDSQLSVYNLETDNLTNLTEGHSPSWQNNEAIIFYKKEIKEMQLVNTDLYRINPDDKNLEKLTDTKEKFEIDPSFDVSSNRIIYNEKNTNSIKSISLSKGLQKTSTPLFNEPKEMVPFYPKPVLSNSKLQSYLDVPYIHQVYDVPDWYWGYYACAPTTSAMLLAYYKILPKWETTCSSPSNHKNNWGRYICEKYHYNEWFYNDGSSPNGHQTGYGGYGYMWGTGGSPNSRMLKYHEKHGLTGAQSWNAQGKWSEAVSEITNGYPYSMCVWLTGSGHLVLGKGIVENKHSIVVNDPYGNRNTPGYPSYDGKGATYDWPGYNHGNINLAYAGSGLPWVVKSHYNIPSPPDTLIDDFHLEQGFSLNTVEPASMLNYFDKKSGYNNHFWYMKSNTSKAVQFAEWNPDLDKDGNYALSVYIPQMEGKTQNAVYQIFNGEKWEDISVNQAFYNDYWVSLGIFSLEAGNVNKIRLTDSTNSDGEIIVIDALKWNFVGEWAMDFESDNISGSAPFTASFHERIEYSSQDCNYLWNFGDGITSDEENPVHIYKFPGIYDVALTLFIGSKEYSISKENYIEVTENMTIDFDLFYPLKDTTLTTGIPTFSWQSIDGINGYRFFLNTTSDFSNIESILVDSNYFQYPDSLKDNTEYFWKIEAISGTDTLKSGISYFKINLNNDPPQEFSLTFPQNNAILKSEFCTFQWQKSSDQDIYDEINYSLNLQRNDEESHIIYDGYKQFFSDTLMDNSVYYWNVVASDKNNGNTTNSGGHHKFIVNKFNDDPSIVTLLKPENNSIISNDYPNFSWSPSIDIDPDDSVSYEIYIFKLGRETSGATRAIDTCYYDNQKISSESIYGWTVKTLDQNGGFSLSDTFYFNYSTTGLDDISSFPTEFKLHQNFPNPFNPSTSIAFELPENGNVELTIYDINGNLVDVLLNRNLSAGNHTKIWNPMNVSSGIYFYELKYSDNRINKTKIMKCLYIK